MIMATEGKMLQSSSIPEPTGVSLSSDGIYLITASHDRRQRFA